MAPRKRTTTEPAGNTSQTRAVEGELLDDTGSAIAEYRPTEAGLAALREQYGTVPDVSTKEGMQLAREARRDCVSLRTTLEAKRKELKAPLLERGKLIDDEAKRIIGAIVEVENPHDEAIKAEEARIEARREAARKERERVAAASQAVIDNLRDIPIRLLDSAAAAIQAAIDELLDTDVENLGDLLADDQERAEQAKEAAIERLRTMHSARAEADRIRAEQAAEAERLAEERKQADRERAEQAQRDAADRKRRDEIDRRLRALQHLGLALTASDEIREARDMLLTAEINEATFGDRLPEAEAAYDEAKVRIEKQLDAALERERIEAEQAERERQLQEREAQLERERQEREAAAERERQAQERAAAAERERARQEAEQAAIDKATLVEAAKMALELLREVGQAEHVSTRALGAAIDRAEHPAQAVQS